MSTLEQAGKTNQGEGSSKVEKRDIEFVRLYVKVKKGCIYKVHPLLLG